MPAQAAAPEPSLDTNPGAGDRATTPRPPRRRLAIALAAVAVVIVIAVVVVLVSGGDDESDTVTRAPAAAVTLAQLEALAARSDAPVYWAGARPGATYELTRTEDGRIFIRYVPDRAAVGSPRASFLSIGTYPQDDALRTLGETARARGARTFALPGGGRAFTDSDRPTRVYLAMPGSDVQVEIYDPVPGRAAGLVRSGQIAPLGAGAAAAVGPVAASVAALRAVAQDAGHPVYWAGAESGTTYELTRTADGRIYVRYLPSGVEAGNADPSHLTVGTYPQPDALARLRATAARRGAESFELDGGGFGYVDREVPDSVYLAYPGADVQVEVYDPSGSRARELAASGRIVPVG